MRKHLLKRFIVFALLLSLLITTTAGCASKSNDEVKEESNTTKGGEDTGKTEINTSNEPVTIRLVHYMGEQAKRDALDKILAAFNEAYPHITVDIEVVSSSSYIATYKNYIAAGEAPDIMFGKPQTMKEFVDSGYFMDLSEEAFLENVLPMLVDECTVNDGVYGFPIDAQVKACFYNKSMFADAGIEVPTTREAFFAACDTFMEQGIYPIVHPYNFIHGVFHELDSFITNMAVETGNETLWMDSQEGIANLADNEMVIEALTMFSKFASYKDGGDTAIDQTQGIQNFAAGQRPMYMNGGWLMGDVIATEPEDDFGMFPTPWSDNPEENKVWIGIDDVFVVSSQTDHKDEVVLLLEFLANEESSKTWMDTAKLMTSNTQVSTDDADAFIQEIKAYIDQGKAVSKSLVPDYTSEYSTAFRTKLQEFVTFDDDHRDVAKLLKDIDEEIAAIRQ